MAQMHRSPRVPALKPLIAMALLAIFLTTQWWWTKGNCPNFWIANLKSLQNVQKTTLTHQSKDFAMKSNPLTKSMTRNIPTPQRHCQLWNGKSTLQSNLLPVSQQPITLLCRKLQKPQYCLQGPRSPTVWATSPSASSRLRKTATTGLRSLPALNCSQLKLSHFFLQKWCQGNV